MHAIRQHEHECRLIAGGALGSPALFWCSWLSDAWLALGGWVLSLSSALSAIVG